MKNPQEQIKVNMTLDVVKGVYANFVQIAHGKEEFALDFITFFTSPEGNAVARVFLSPACAKRLVNSLAINIKKFEEQFGKIDENEFSYFDKTEKAMTEK